MCSPTRSECARKMSKDQKFIASPMFLSLLFSQCVGRILGAIMKTRMLKRKKNVALLSHNTGLGKFMLHCYLIRKFFIFGSKCNENFLLKRLYHNTGIRSKTKLYYLYIYIYLFIISMRSFCEFILFSTNKDRTSTKILWKLFSFRI